MEHKKESNIIYFKDLLFAALYHWRTVLIVALAAAALLGGYKAVSSLGTSNKSVNTQYQTQLEQYQLKTTELENKLETLNNSLANQQVYLENSILINLNPYEFYEVSLNLYVDTNYRILPNMSYQNLDKTTAVLSAYAAGFSSEQGTSQLAEAINTQPHYITELVSCSHSAASGSLTISIRCASNEDAKILLDTLAAQVSSLHTDIDKNVADHTVTILEKNITRKVDMEILNLQTQADEHIATLQENITLTEKELSSLSAPSPFIEGAPIGKGIVMFTLLGLALGICLSVGISWIQHILSNKVYSSRILQNRTGVKILGCMRSKPHKVVVDRWLCRMEGRCVADIDSQAKLLATNIRTRCSDSAHILVTGTAADAAQEILVQALRTALPDKRISSERSLCYSPEALSALAECDTVVLTAQCGLSRYCTVSEETQIILDCKKNLVGCVLVDG